MTADSRQPIADSRLPLAARSLVCGLVLFGLAGIAESSGEDDVLKRYEARVDVDAAGNKLPYRLLSPPGIDPTDASRRYPLVLFLHGAGERGTDNEKQLVHGMRDFASDEHLRRYPCFVVAPQCPDGMQWVDTPWSAPRHTMPETPTPALAQAIGLVEKLAEQLPVDRRRLYVTGLSMGGFGAWDAAQRRPELFAALAPVCGGGDTALAPRLAQLPIWAFHGAEDTVVVPRRSRDMIEALRAAGGMPKYTEYPKVGHNSWVATYADPEFHAWLFAQHRAEPGR